ncbi:hypothetical protein Poly30_51220 [Planctomycetes bacterium Poly30]|uniref:Leucine Rich repeats (2 copies) n=2 Tax=Saltatorellus ferox TaxID=2528018 RepID=A0A518EZQ4_9BACT|nr:hypothetical protein Poly30_51220 [Planctomycetes bacterium Poly30]
MAAEGLRPFGGTDDEIDARFRVEIEAIRDLDLTAMEQSAFERYGVEWLDQLPQLETLRLCLNDPAGLKTLYVMGNYRYVGEMHDVHFEGRPHLPSLKYLSIETNAQQDLAAFANAPRLEQLEIITSLGLDLTPFATCENLRSLTVREGEGQLHETATGQTKSGELERYAVLQQLTTLEVPHGLVTDTYEPLLGMKNLDHLALREPHDGHATVLDQLRWLTSLTFVVPSGVNLSARSLESWSAALPKTDISIIDPHLIEPNPWRSRVPFPAAMQVEESGE